MGVTVLVALRKESVDRNIFSLPLVLIFLKSLSARRAWIEILTDDVSTGGKIVALRKESVDRNTVFLILPLFGAVALRKESVDRNDTVQIVIIVMHGRSPQGERG